MPKLIGVIDAQQFNKRTLEVVFRIAKEMEKTRNRSMLAGKILISLFYEPSTRTRFSFESAMLRLGGNVISTENAREFSSAAKGESLEDSIRVTSGYGDVIVLRYHKEGGAKKAQNISSIPVINAGDGTGQHPTQAILDLYTITKIFGHFKGLRIAMMGDLANGRTVRSLCYFIAKHYPDNEILFISPKETRMRDDIKAYLDRYNVHWEEHSKLTTIIGDADIFYQTRIQQERFKNKRTLKKVQKTAKELYITAKKLSFMKKDAIIMHPLPHLKEIGKGVDENPRARYFEQAQNGLYVRMALLKMILVGY